jgi:16S rRNA (guanine966-N2)-methyltransferase
MQIISGIYKSRKILAPKGKKTRPTSGKLREALFNICQNEIEGALFLDLYAGTGAMGLEALSRGAKHATFVDNDRESIRCIHSNLSAFGIEMEADVICADVFEAMKKLSKRGCQYDLIYADPPYGISYSAQVLALIEELPLLNKGGRLFLEDASGSLPEKRILKHLILKDSRKMGRSVLQHWEHRKE